MNDLADQIRDLLPHGTFDIRVRYEPSGATVLKVTCRCGCALDWAGSLPGRLLFDWLANHRDEMFLTDAQLQETYQAKVPFLAVKTAQGNAANAQKATPAVSWAIRWNHPDGPEYSAPFDDERWARDCFAATRTGTSVSTTLVVSRGGGPWVEVQEGNSSE